MSTSDAMRKAARAAIEKPLPIQQAAPAPEIIEALEAIKARLDREAMPTDGKVLEGIRAQLDRQGQETVELRAAVDTLTVRQQMTPPAAAACEAAAGRMTKAAEAVSSGARTLQDAARAAGEAVEEVLSYRENRGRRLAAALVLAVALPNVLGTLWLAWRIGVL